MKNQLIKDITRCLAAPQDFFGEEVFTTIERDLAKDPRSFLLTVSNIVDYYDELKQLKAELLDIARKSGIPKLGRGVAATPWALPPREIKGKIKITSESHSALHALCKPGFYDKLWALDQLTALELILGLDADDPETGFFFGSDTNLLLVEPVLMPHHSPANNRYLFGVTVDNRTMMFYCSK